MNLRSFLLCALLGTSACASVDDSDLDANGGLAIASNLGGRYDATKSNVTFRVRSDRATRIEVWIYKAASGQAEVLRQALTNDGTGRWSTTVSVATLASRGLSGTIYYGYRAWGPNWTYSASWTPGSSLGFASDVDGNGNRFNPNKLLFDPYGLELSHDPTNPSNSDGTIYNTGATDRLRDSALVAPKSIVIDTAAGDFGTKPTRALKDDVVYEVHVRGFTKNDPSVPVAERGTYAGAGKKAAYLKSIGVTAIEFLPIQETVNDGNDVVANTTDDNYWGYMTLNYFAPDRRYAADKTAGGPTREIRAMVKAFHDQGIKVYMDVVYNHTAEGGVADGTGTKAQLLSFRGLDNASYYELGTDAKFYYDNTGIGANYNTTTQMAVDLIIHSLQYWKGDLGFDGFRFDLASVLGNSCNRGCFNFDKLNPSNALNRAVIEVGARPAGGGSGVDLIGEPWAIGDGTYRVGDFPSGWSEWNGIYRDTFRKDQNKLGVDAVTPGQLATRFAGSSDLYADDGRAPWASVNFVVAHDGFTNRDLYAYNAKNNLQPWPYGPSDGGEDNNVSWDQGGDPVMQRKAARNAMAFLALSAGVPMFTGGDEMYRTQYGNNNAYNLDTDKNWLNWTDATTNAQFLSFSRRLFTFRGAHPALRRAGFYTGAVGSSGLKDIQWLTDQGVEGDGAYMSNAGNHFLGFRIDGAPAGDSAASIYVAYNGWSGTVTARLPTPRAGKSWYRVGDTAPWMESRGNFTDPGAEDLLTVTTYDLAPRSLLILIER
ncbi:MAG TPA: isoamylase [Kofleriaceae bacterium]|nr:isoamylase [Kofleriaceae bacterium]